MADLTDLQATDAVKIVGANSVGVETNAVNADSSGNLQTIDPSTGLLNVIAPTRGGLIAGLEVDSGNLVAVAVDIEGRLITSALTGFGAAFSFGDVATAAITTVTVRRTAYIEQTTNAQRSVVSASASDTSIGTGARTIRLTYLDSTGAGPFTETITMNGMLAVNTINTNICFIEKIEVVTAGAIGSNIGLISLRAAIAGAGVTIWSISATDNRTFGTHHYIPIGKIANITGISCGHNGTTVGSGALFVLRSKPIDIVNAVEVQISDFVRLYGQSSTFARTYVSPIKISGPARLIAYVTPETATSIIYRCAFDYFEP